ncbi:MAG: hypothetical protein HQ510_10820 [Candidatus Marinimicrobia bacterium]|nr:hypothetical protein [Candidatus Neomarinimicrobiota bacterium]
MNKNSDIALIIDTLAKPPISEKARAATVALLNVIPYAGGAVAAIIGEVATSRRIERICDILSSLNSRLESQGIEPTEHLTEDQIIEVVHDTLNTASKTSNHTKLKMLKGGLSYTFLQPDSFERKQLYLEILRNATSIEISIVTWVYGQDPFVVHRGSPSSNVETTPDGIILNVRSHLDAYQVLGTAGGWIPSGIEDCEDQHSLLSHISTALKCDEGTTIGGISLSDAKGLTNLGHNLANSGPCRILEWQDGSAGVMSVMHSGAITFETPKQTPVEASRTDFGKQFLDFCMKY